MEIWRELRQAHPAPCSTSIVTLQHSALPHSVSALALATPAPQPLHPGISMDIDVAWQHHPTLLLCQRCKKPGHFARHCLLGLKVRYLSAMEQEELLLQLLAAKDTAGALSPDELALELAQEEQCIHPPPGPGGGFLVKRRMRFTCLSLEDKNLKVLPLTYKGHNGSAGTIMPSKGVNRLPSDCGFNPWLHPPGHTLDTTWVFSNAAGKPPLPRVD
ncbi:hypothetical protein C0993_005832 [Termitomyces sp. T159_Od127]|nr:hypothetical protein C0993_005832 [Termitomyces sp. T159_Od127]